MSLNESDICGRKTCWTDIHSTKNYETPVDSIVLVNWGQRSRVRDLLYVDYEAPDVGDLDNACPREHHDCQREKDPACF